MTTAQLTPVADQTPAVAEIHNELSGAQWVSRFPASVSTADLEPNFQAAVDRFIAALRQAGAPPIISCTYRPPERCYLMHWSWEIAHGVDPNSVPDMDGVNIEWVHSTQEASVKAANDMVNSYGMQNLRVPPSLNSRHTQRQAIDMSISWQGMLKIVDANSNVVEIATTPRTGMNADLHSVAASYGVIKFVGGNADPPHWSTDGH